MMERAGNLNNQNINWQLWQQHNKPIELFTFAVIKQKLDNLHNNPVEVGFVAKASDWIYGSTIDYAGGKGLIDVKLLYE